MKIIHTMIKQVHDTHARILSADVKIAYHIPTDDFNQICQLRNANPDCVIVVSRRVAAFFQTAVEQAPEYVVVDTSNIYCLVDQPDQETINQPFDALFRPVAAFGCKETSK